MFRPLAVAVSALIFAGGTQTTVPAAAPAELRYTADGQMQVPDNYREWVYLTSGLGMSYQPTVSANMEPMFDNVFVNPSSYRSFMATGTWPDKTVLVLEVRGSETKVSIDQHGHSQGPVHGLEVHVKDASLPGKWGFFEFDPGQKAAKIVPPQADCYSCHQQHAAVDTTFVQFYPTLIDLAKEKKTLSPEYLKEIPKPAN
jgi:hypothetical protein